MSDKIELKFDQERLKKVVTLDDLIGMQDGDLHSIRRVLGHFVLNSGGEYLPFADGLKAIGGLTIEQLEGVTSTFLGKTEESIVPNESGAV
jgi:hypothetical protein